jgi:nucleolar complex protein 3
MKKRERGPKGGAAERPKKKKKEKRNEAGSDAAGPTRKEKLQAQHQNVVLSPIQSLTRQERINLIAELSEAILEDPSSAFSTPKTESQKEHEPEDAEAEPERETEHFSTKKSKMKLLLDLADLRQAPAMEEGHVSTARLAMVSILALFQDLLPSYRIRLPTAAETAVRVNRERKQLWNYERSLLTHYQAYLKLLERTWDQRNKLATVDAFVVSAYQGLAVTAVLSLCELLKTAPHFNFRSNILSVVVRQTNNLTCEEVSEACCVAVRHVFATDTQGEIALEATRSMAKLIKERFSTGNRVVPRVLKTFLSLPLRVHEDEAQAAKLAAAANAKKRKKDKELAEIENDMREGDATVDKIILARCQSETLQTITLTYFRILKSDDLGKKGMDGSSSHVAELLPAALEGLAKVAHLINIDTVVDLLQVLKDLLKQHIRDLPLDAALNCIMTAFQTLHGPGREMPVDQKEFVVPLYGQIPRLCTEYNAWNHTELMLQCLNAAFLKRRELSTVRAAAFIKQMCTVALHAPSYTSGPILAFVRQMIHRYPSMNQLLENEQEVVMSGAYTPDAEDPEHTNPFATSAWELATLKFHVSPMVAEHAVGAASEKMLQLPAEAPLAIWKNLSQDTSECYIAQPFHQKRHPLAERSDDNSKKRRRTQVRFITPRQTQNYHLK